MLRSSVIKEIGMFDKRFKNYCQDSEWCLRAMTHGYDIATVYSSRVRHLGSSTLTNYETTLEADRQTLLKILSCYGMQKILEAFPLNAMTKEYGRITFDTFNKSTTA